MKKTIATAKQIFRLELTSSEQLLVIANKTTITDTDIQLVIGILDSEPELTKLDASGEALILSAKNNHASISQLLLKKIPYANEAKIHALNWAALAGYKNYIEIFLENTTVDINSYDQSGRPPLISAVIGGHEDVVTLLLDHGADINIRLQETRNSPKKVVGEIFTHYTNTNIPADTTGLQCAVAHNNLAMVQLLLNKGIDKDAANARGATALHIAILCNHKNNLPIIKELLQAGVDINATEDAHMTALHLAVRRKRKEIVELLLENGANMSIINIYGFTALEYARGLPKVKPGSGYQPLITLFSDVSIRASKALQNKEKNNQGTAVTESLVAFPRVSTHHDVIIQKSKSNINSHEQFAEVSKKGLPTIESNIGFHEVDERIQALHQTAQRWQQEKTQPSMLPDLAPGDNASKSYSPTLFALPSPVPYKQQDLINFDEAPAATDTCESFELIDLTFPDVPKEEVGKDTGKENLDLELDRRALLG